MKFRRNFYVKHFSDFVTFYYGGSIFMFNNTFSLNLSKNNLASLEISTDPENYISPLLKSRIKMFQKNIEIDNYRDKLYSLCFSSIIYQLWSEHSKKFTAKSKLIYNPELNCYEFVVAQKVVGNIFSTAKTNMFGLLGKRIKCTAFLYVRLSVIMSDNTLTIRTKHYKTVAQQHSVNLKISEEEIDYGTFLVKDRTMFINPILLKNLSDAFYKTISEIFLKLPDIEIFNGDFLDCLNFLDSSSNYCSKNCQVIEAVYYMASKIFPLFNELNYDEQLEILEKVCKNTRNEVTNFQKYKAYFQYSIFAKNLYYELVKKHLDATIILGKFSKKLTLQKWSGRFSTLLYSEEDFQKFDYQNCNPDELIWVRYDSSNYHVNEIYSKLIPSPNIISSLKISRLLEKDESTSEEIS